MKKHLSLLTLSAVLFTMATVSAQINDRLKPKLPKGPVIQQKTELDLAIIKQNIDNGKACYTLSTAVAYLDAATDSKTPPKQAYSTSTNYLRSESNYVIMNSLMLLSEKSFSRVAGNSFEVILRPNGAKINPNDIKVTWRFGDIGIKTFSLDNVEIVYSKTGITLTGHKTVEGKQLAFSMAISEISCLI